MREITVKLQHIFLIYIVAILFSADSNADQTTRYTHSESGQLLTVDGPRTDVSDVITYTYNEQGNLATTTNPLGQVTTFISYDSTGNLLSMRDANGVVTEFTYHVRGWLLTSRVKHPTDSSLDAITTYTYDAIGQLTSTVLSNGVSLSYEYDGARRLIAIENNAEERIEYTLDAAGNRTKQVIKSSTGGIKYSVDSTFDELSRVKDVLGNNGQKTNHKYDVNNNLTHVTDGRNNQTQQVYDALNRVKQIIGPDLGETHFTYNQDNQITSVTDARGNTTTYNYDLFGDLTSIVSPDTGTTNFIYDSAANRTRQIDARGVVTNFTYDALNRLTKIEYPASPSENVNYMYDDTGSGNYGVGRLTSVYSDLQSTEFVYNHLGLITHKYITIGSSTFEIQYAYDSVGNLTQIIYPSGRIVNYSLDAQGRVNGISTKANATALSQTLISNAEFLPFGSVSNFKYGNGLIHSRIYDQDYRLSNIQVGGVLSRSYGYDPVNNITSIVNALNNSENQIFSYDDINRLISAAGDYGTFGYSYDKVGNRLTQTRNGATDIYTYATASNQLQLIAHTAGNRSFEYDGAGNQTQRTSDTNIAQTFTYNQANRLTSVNANSSLVATYSYNPFGQKVAKVLSNGNKEFYHYDESGQLIAVTDGAGSTLREYVYWGNQQIAFFNVSQGYSISGQTLDESNVSFQGAHVIGKNNAGYTGSGFIDYVGEGSASWSVNIPASTNYNLTLRYGLSGTNRPLTLKVDGTTVSTINFVSSPLWTTWKTQTITLNLQAGQHNISLHTAGLSGPNIDKIELAAVEPIAIPTSALYFIHHDHLGTPQVITNQNQQVVWMGDYEPFGKVATNASNSIEIFSRFPGQYLDPETGLYYNYFRDYDPSIGRYIESDPIGLRGGINTYAYALMNPNAFTDPNGLNSVVTAQDIGGSINDGGYDGYSEAIQAWKDARAASAQVPVGNMGLGESAYLGPRDAVRHCVLACSLTQRLGRDKAVSILNRHEANGGEADEMDNRNNQMGCFLGENSDPGACQQACLRNIDYLYTRRDADGNILPQPTTIGGR